MARILPQKSQIMERLAERLKSRARELGLSNAEVARRAGLSETRYAHYCRGRSEPDLGTFTRIARVLDTTPHALMGLDADGRPAEDVLHPAGHPRRGLSDRLKVAAESLGDRDLDILVRQAEAFADGAGEAD
ncbi:MAG: helix-turn-helix transcriptional regulator [Alphaproteobacteria bacterium]|nr:helix-turn-helix transcriptional regulator [Alphaproteobacteria bacterium]